MSQYEDKCDPGTLTSNLKDTFTTIRLQTKTLYVAAMPVLKNKFTAIRLHNFI